MDIMEQEALVRHAIHPMLMPFPIALWIFSLASDCMYAFQFGGPVWKEIALYTMVAGVGGGLAAAIPAYFDYRAVMDPQMAHLARRYMLFNGLIVLLYSLNAGLRLVTGPDVLMPVVASVVGVCLLVVSTWWSRAFTSAEAQPLEAQPWKQAA
jgi:uncharacterized membrane protein